MDLPDDSPPPNPPTAPPELIGRAQVVRLGVLFEGGAIVLAIVLAWLFKVELRSKLAIAWFDVQVGLAATVPLLAMLLLTTYFPIGPIKHVQRFLDSYLLPMLKDCTIVDLAVISILAGVGEELLFRGVLQDGMVQRWGIPAGVAVASLLFGLAHFVNASYFGLITLVGIYLGLVRIASDSLSGVMLTHALYDFIALVFLLRIHRNHDSGHGGEPDAAPDPNDADQLTADA